MAGKISTVFQILGALVCSSTLIGCGSNDAEFIAQRTAEFCSTGDGLLELASQKHVFEVNQSYTIRRNSDGTASSVEFAVESTAPSPPYQLRTLASISRTSGEFTLADIVQKAYSSLGMSSNPGGQGAVTVETYSSNLNAAEVNGRGMFSAVAQAFNNHESLLLNPDDLWVTIMYAFGTHVDLHAEDLRENFVSFEGKVRLLAKSRLVPGQTTPKDFEESIFPQFSAGIAANTHSGIHGILADSFSTSGPVDIATAQVMLMSTMKNYFEYVMYPICGIPKIILNGTLGDWQALYDRSKALQDLVTPDFQKFWFPHLLPVLEEFIKAYQGDVNIFFWQNFYKKRTREEDMVCTTVTKTSLSGWLGVFFPYLAERKLNPHMGSWEDLIAGSGPDNEDIPAILSSAPVKWFYYDQNGDEQEVNTHFHAGSIGLARDTTSQALHAVNGWIVSHDPPNTDAH
eukprot:TRINITY_DN21915_c0_g1_i1.p1 TRINITY_DN21915_c0_g1~~TRINITY_DN21915_c0_g1_i1.p1  ORF type:complete len:457 (+),score=81.91 TRINITY_DN21915_c0_g1_i1:74-1444(+)